MEIHSHAVDRYIERVLNLKPEQAGFHIREMARIRIREAASDPEQTYHEMKEEPPIHIRGQVAVPVDGATVPTAYHSNTFTSKMDA